MRAAPTVAVLGVPAEMRAIRLSGVNLQPLRSICCPGRERVRGHFRPKHFVNQLQSTLRLLKALALSFSERGSKVCY